MKVCLVSKHFIPYVGGLEVRVLGLARWLAGKGDSVIVLTSHERGTKSSEVIDGVVVRRSTVVLDVFNALFTPGILFDLIREEYDVIDVNLPDPVNSIFAYFASVLRRKPLFVTYHADIIREGIIYMPFKLVYAPLEWLVLKRARKIFVTSPNYASSSLSLKGFLSKTVVAPSFVEFGRYSRRTTKTDVRKTLSLGGKMVLFVGRLVAYKGVEYLLDAAAEVPDASFVIVGDGVLSDGLRQKAKELNLNNVVFAGHVSDDDLPDYYLACDVFVLPSVTRQEAFGLVLVEAMAFGKPVISTNFSGMPYVVGDAGLLVEPRNPKALAEAVRKIISDPELAVKLGANGKKRVEELFEKDVVCKGIRETYLSSL
jgi:glycosyltransferase involved in cell wall biosynthesis